MCFFQVVLVCLSLSLAWALWYFPVTQCKWTRTAAARCGGSINLVLMLFLGIYCPCRALLLQGIPQQSEWEQSCCAYGSKCLCSPAWRSIFFVVIVHQNSPNSFEEPVGQEQWGKGSSCLSSCCFWVIEAEGTMWLSQFWAPSFLSWLPFWAEIWLLLSLGLDMKDSVFVLKYFASRLCLEQQRMEWKTCSHDSDKCWNGLASRKDCTEEFF